MTDTQVKDLFLEASSRKKTTPIFAVYKEDCSSFVKGLTAAQKKYLDVKSFKGTAGQVELLFDEEGAVEAVVVGLGAKDEPMIYNLFGDVPFKLPEGAYHFDGDFSEGSEVELFDATLAWGLGTYRFNDYKPSAVKEARVLKLSKAINAEKLLNILTSVYLGRDLINTPANDLGPDVYEERIKLFAAQNKAKMSVVKGDALLVKKFPLIHAVGRASTQAPRLVELNWGKKSDPKVTLVGKGICFDTGGLNLKPGAAMNLMKKDMGGSAAALTIASMVMGAKLPLNLRVLLPLAENNISGNAFRPGDVLPSRKGLTVEIENTDAEGRLVLADALALADEQEVDELFCFATLTGAARVGMGPDLPPFYTDDDEMAEGLESSSRTVSDYMWRLPFWQPYDKWLNSQIADVNHISAGPFAGSITAGLFLRRFVENAKRFVHFDIYGWTPKALPGKPVGGEPQVARAVFDYLEKKYK